MSNHQAILPNPSAPPRLPVKSNQRWTGLDPRKLTWGALYCVAAGCITQIFDLSNQTLPFRIDFLYGTYWQRRFMIPVLFWVMTLIFTLINFSIENRYQNTRLPKTTFREKRVQALGLGLYFHMSCLLAQFLRLHESSDLQSGSFKLYTNLVACGLLILSGSFGLTLAGRAISRSELKTSKRFISLSAAPFWTAPILFSILSGPKWGLVVFIGSALLASVKTLQMVALRTVEWIWNEKVFPWFLYLVAFAFRASAGYRLGSMGLQTVLLNSDDAQQYHYYSTWILEGKKIPLYYSIGASAWVAFLRLISRDHVVLNLVFQSAALSFIPILIYFIGRRAFSRQVGQVASLLCALSQLLIFNSVNWTREGVGALALVLALYVTICHLPNAVKNSFEKTFHWAPLVGISIGALILIDPMFSLCFISFLGLWLVMSRKSALRKRVTFVCLVAASAMLTIALCRWYLHGTPGLKLRQLGDDKSLAGKFYAGYNDLALQLYDKRVNFLDFPVESLKNVLTDPSKLGLFIGKVWFDFKRYLFESQTGQFDPILLKRNSILAANLNFYAYTLGLLGYFSSLTMLIRTRFSEKDSDLQWSRIAVIVIPSLHAIAYCTLIFGYTRFRATVQPLFHLFLAVGIVMIFDGLKKRALQLLESN